MWRYNTLPYTLVAGTITSVHFYHWYISLSVKCVVHLDTNGFVLHRFGKGAGGAGGIFKQNSVTCEMFINELRSPGFSCGNSAQQLRYDPANYGRSSCSESHQAHTVKRAAVSAHVLCFNVEWLP